MARLSVDTVLASFWPAGKVSEPSVWAILDGARDRRVFPFLRDSGLAYLCLYSGHLPRELQFAAPYIVELSKDGAHTRRLIDLAWGNSWGVFLSIEDSSNLRHHLRKFLKVRSESGKSLLFRYYDPRVLRVYLPTCLPDELKTVFGPIQSFWVEDEAGQSLLEFYRDGNRLGRRRISSGEGEGA